MMLDLHSPDDGRGYQTSSPTEFLIWTSSRDAHSIGGGGADRNQPLQAQPLPFLHSLSREMQLSPQALPALHVLQHPLAA